MEPLPAPAFAWSARPWGRALCCVPLQAVAAHLFTARDVDLRGPGAEAGWTRVAATLGVAPARLARLEQVHGVEMVTLRAADGVATSASDAGLPHADAVMTDDPATAVAIQVADCVPILLTDSRTGAVAAVHAGWRGTSAGVARRAVQAMGREFGSRPSDLVAAIGPSIGACCYQVGPDVIEAFRAAGAGEAGIGTWFRPEVGGDRFRLDVPGANRDQLIDAGLADPRIHLCGLCTFCHPALFHSYRRDGRGTGRLAGVIRAAGPEGPAATRRRG